MKTTAYVFPTETAAIAAVEHLRNEHRQSDFLADHVTQVGPCQVTRNSATLTIGSGNSAERHEVRQEIARQDRPATTGADRAATPRQIAYLRSLIADDYGAATTAGLIGRDLRAMSKADASVAITRMQNL